MVSLNFFLYFGCFSFNSMVSTAFSPLFLSVNAEICLHRYRSTQWSLITRLISGLAISKKKCFTRRFSLVLLYHGWLLTRPSGLTLGINHKHLCFLPRLVYMYMTQLVKRLPAPMKAKEVYFCSSLATRLLSFGHVPPFHRHLFRI